MTRRRPAARSVRGPVDLPRVAAALGGLRELAREHPEIVGPSSPENTAAWEATLAADENGENMPEPTIQCAFRLPESLVARVDAYADRLNEDRPGMGASRADAVRVLLTRALDAVAPARPTSTRTPPRGKSGGASARKAKATR